VFQLRFEPVARDLHAAGRRHLGLRPTASEAGPGDRATASR
jgi:hypothetical protein